MMSYLNQSFRAGLSLLAFMCLSLLLFAATAQAQQPTLPALPATCDYTSEPANISLTAQNIPAGFSTIYLLVNMTSGLIVQTNQTAPVFNGVSRGLYYAVPAHYSGSLNNASAGKLISDVYSTDQCLTYGSSLALKVCSPTCDYAAAPASVTFTAQSVPVGVNTSYVLVNTATNLIAQVSNTASFAAVPLGDYAITSVHYTGGPASGSLTALSVGNSLYDVTTQQANCLSVSNTLYIKVCNSPVAITGPLDGTTMATLNPVISGTATPGSSVTVTAPNGQSCVTTASTPGGTWTCSGITFPAGPTSVTATDGITTAVSNFTVASPPSLTVTGPVNVTTTTTPTISGTATPGSTVAITDPSGTTLCTTTASPSGTFACALTIPLPGGPNTLTVTASGPGGSISQPITFTAIVPCTTPSIGGVTSFTGNPLCSVSNAGAVTLSGQTGTVVKWQTSTNGGISWTDIAGTAGLTSYGFVNAANNQQFRAVVNSGNPAGGDTCVDANSTTITTTTSSVACTVDCNVLPSVIVK
ncbi:Ig-like domain-containing protein [Spirosoma pollinicola]|uniref:Bacterial Ig domain-containing protein n=1 Tax=Spirosoma pollinicola TaxID=2057025 RepID=A0A2K8Z8P7_9BACT|nr:Ig-like domain-containing protein [Spirosoma pollinicola]AUD06241.1 hypothetical protein CWM47_33000 [Spirosoma pollinicola]